MSKLTLDQIAQKVAEMWLDDAHKPIVKAHESRMMIMHPFGHYVFSDVTRADLEQPMDHFVAKILAPALEELRKAAK
jgi:hypothetical protein